ncbi:hypothetical protein FIBSPDRAFT_339075 [Athelia psychrophila]|uniref:Uncharacterized protein n=1 Tax=Athelia psychrophila TaxID=1759441 RepID=A0A167W9X2_9AGAM|nr:hypothetical protein FIBSPDRAFT_339075 [Fibularhizoctonia sp. CBS 109695]
MQLSNRSSIAGIVYDNAYWSDIGPTILLITRYRGSLPVHATPDQKLWSSVEANLLVLFSSLSRSFVYASFAETWTRLTTIRAYTKQKRIIEDVDRGLDRENRGSFVSVAIARWLDPPARYFTKFCHIGNLILRGGLQKQYPTIKNWHVAPSSSGYDCWRFRQSVTLEGFTILSYTLTAAQWFSEMVHQFVQPVQNMNTLERVFYYYTDLLSKTDAHTSIDSPANWHQ